MNLDQNKNQCKIQTNSYNFPNVHFMLKILLLCRFVTHREILFKFDLILNVCDRKTCPSFRKTRNDRSYNFTNQ